MDRYDFYKMFRENLDDALRTLKSEDFNWFVDKIKEDIKEIEEDE